MARSALTVISSSLVAVIAANIPSVAIAGGSEDPRSVLVCHQPGTPAQKTLRLPVAAAEQHIGDHGDRGGPCRISAIAGPAGVTIHIDDRENPLDGASVTVPAAALDRTTTMTIAAVTKADLEAAVGDLPVGQRYMGGLAITADVAGVGVASPLRISLPNTAGATSNDQLLMGEVTTFGSRSALVYRGPAQLGSINFSIAGFGRFVVLSPSTGLVLGQSTLYDQAYLPVADAVIAASGAAPFIGITDTQGRFTVPVGAAGTEAVVIGVPPDRSQGIALLDTQLPPGPLPTPIVELLPQWVLQRFHMDPPDLPPCSEPEPLMVLASTEGQPLAGISNFRLTADGPPLHTFAYAPNGEVYEPDNDDVPPSPWATTLPLDLVMALFTGAFDLATEVSFATFNPGTGDPDSSVATVDVTTGLLEGVGAGQAAEVATVKLLRYENQNGHPVPCMKIASATRPVEVKPKLTIVTATMPQAHQDVPYSASLEAIGGWPDYVWEIVSEPGVPSLPDGLALSPGTNVIAGTPTTYGTWAVIVRATDANLPPTLATRALNLTVRPPSLLRVAAIGNGQGTVQTVAPHTGIQCPPDCTEQFPADATVVLIAIPASGSQFAGWSGDCTGTAQTTTIETSSDKQCVAQFDSAITFTFTHTSCTITNSYFHDGMNRWVGYLSCTAALTDPGEYNQFGRLTVRVYLQRAGAAACFWNCSGFGQYNLLLYQGLPTQQQWSGSVAWSFEVRDFGPGDFIATFWASSTASGLIMKSITVQPQ